jgi:LysM domain
MRFKIVIFFLAVAFLAGTFLTAKWYIENIDRPEIEAQAALQKREAQSKKGKGPDPGLAVFDKAIDLIREKELEPARERLTYITKIYRDSQRYADARRVLGEMNIDRLFSRNPMPGKYDYTVKRGDSLLGIAKGSATTIPFLIRLNNMTGSTLQPGDHLVCQPLDFQVELAISERRLTLGQRDAATKAFVYFKDYQLTDVNLPSHAMPRKPSETKISQKIAMIEVNGQDKTIQDSDPRYPFSRKAIATQGKVQGRAGFMLRPMSARPMSEEEKRASGGEDINYGLFLADADLEELHTILRLTTPVLIKP